MSNESADEDEVEVKVAVEVAVEWQTKRVWVQFIKYSWYAKCFVLFDFL